MSPRPGRAPKARFFATAAKGTEILLADELAELGLPDVYPARGGVYFGQAREDGYRACLWSRIALRVHEPLASFECRDGDDLYAGVKAIDWSEYLDGQRTLAVRAAGHNDRLTHTHFIAVRAKDAIVDQLRERRGVRPSVDRDAPDLLLFIHLSGEQATVNVDLSGASLHLRGFRAEEGTAPLRETLAAALVRFSGWRGDSALTDPMCGSGMLLLEAGLWAARRAPGLGRDRFGFERWSSFDGSAREVLDRLRGEARAGERQPPPLFGSDSDPTALEQCAANARSAGLKPVLRQVHFARVEPIGAPSALVANPPYGERLERPEHLEDDLDALIERFAGAQRCLIVPRGFGSRLRSTRFQAVFNGPIECELRRYDARPGQQLAARMREASTRPSAPPARASAPPERSSTPPARGSAPPARFGSAPPGRSSTAGNAPSGRWSLPPPERPESKPPRDTRAPPRPETPAPRPSGPRLKFRDKKPPKA